MSETVTLRDLVALEAMGAIISKLPAMVALPGVDDREQAVAIGAFDYADAFMAVRAERDQPSNAASLGEELRLLRQQRDEALAQVEHFRQALKPLVGFSALHDRTLGLPGKVQITSLLAVNVGQYQKLCVALRELLGDPT